MGNIKTNNVSNLKTTEKQSTKSLGYPKFKDVDGNHPLKKIVPEAVVEYQVRTRKGGDVAFFNFDLAREIGLIPENHPNELSKELKEEILHTFSIVIINEYDQMNNFNFPKDEIRPNTYMATRYLQLQHPCKKGTTSGDGRSIWNGQLTHKGRAYDISSCGTGATKLSPACNINKKFYQTGDPTVSYGCGYSEKDEGLGALFFSEILAKNGLQTERVLAIIEFQKGLAINVRVHENLIRPSHMFNHLKQNNLPTLKRMVDYHFDRQVKNKVWQNVSDGKSKYDYFLNQIVETFAEMAANFEDQYIFCWLDWDGDNILMDGGIIDYGSVRQFGLYHHEYRYDDVERWSTSIKEQKQKAKYIVQTFAQIIDYIKNEKKKSIEEFKNHHALSQFDKRFVDFKNRNILHKIGFNSKYQNYLLENCRKEVEDFKEDFTYFEMAKSVMGPKKVPDGINWNAIFCMRDILRELPQMFLSRGLTGIVKEDEFLEIIKSSYATKKDLKRSMRRDLKIRSYQKNYIKLLNLVAKKYKLAPEKVLLDVSMRSSVINKYDRVTGDSITNIVMKIMNRKPKLSAIEISKILKEFTDYQNLNPDKETKVSNFEVEKEHSKIVKGILQIVREFRDGI
jgi:tellurite resistance protein